MILITRLALSLARLRTALFYVEDVARFRKNPSDRDNEMVGWRIEILNNVILGLSKIRDRLEYQRAIILFRAFEDLLSAQKRVRR